MVGLAQSEAQPRLKEGTGKGGHPVEKGGGKGEQENAAGGCKAKCSQGNPCRATQAHTAMAQYSSSETCKYEPQEKGKGRGKAQLDQPRSDHHKGGGEAKGRPKGKGWRRVRDEDNEGEEETSCKNAAVASAAHRATTGSIETNEQGH